MTSFRNPLMTGLVVLLALAAALYLAADRGTGGNDPGGGTLSAADREALNAEPIERGDTPDGPDPSIDLNDPAAVATAYVTAGYSLRDTDAGHTNRRAVPYAAPASPPATVGVLVVTAPPAGRHSTAAVTDVEQVSGEETDTRRGYLVGYRTTVDPGPPESNRRTRYLLLVRQIDGRWLVAGDSADGQVGEP